MKSLISFMVVLLTINGAIAQWTQQNPLPNGTLLSSVYFIDNNTGYVVGDSGTILKSNNAGTTWTSLSSGTTDNLNSLCFTDTNTGYASGTTLLKTTDGGTIWSELPGGGRSICFSNANTGYVVGPDLGVLKTIDAGSNWTYTYIGGNGDLTSVYFTDVNTGYMTSRYAWHGGIFKTIDGGSTWSFSYGTPPLFGIYFTDVNTGYAVGGDDGWFGNSGTICKTTDGGSTWTIIYDSILHTLRSVYFADEYNGYVVGDSGTILKTSNGGTDWTFQNSGTSQNLTSVFFTDVNMGYAVGDSGIILKTTNGGGNLGFGKQPQILNSLKIFPNPVHDELYINLEEGKGVLEINNISGKSLIQMEIAVNNTSIDVSGFDQGIYLVKVSSGNQIFTGKFVKK